MEPNDAEVKSEEMARLERQVVRLNLIALGVVLLHVLVVSAEIWTGKVAGPRAIGSLIFLFGSLLGYGFVTGFMIGGWRSAAVWRRVSEANHARDQIELEQIVVEHARLVARVSAELDRFTPGRSDFRPPPGKA